MNAPTASFGLITGLPQRIERTIQRLRHDKSYPWLGTGLIADLEAIMRLLSLDEFGQWLRAHPDDELQRWGAEVLDAVERHAEADALEEAIDAAVPMGADSETHGEAVERVATECAAMRAVLVETGALAADDTTTDVAALLRALLS